ncbi:MAG TPA: TonB family protein, partial [Nevskiaceae bacterium]|nr:TonB family protein [Nevskiaceae bacterium]
IRQHIIERKWICDSGSTTQAWTFGENVSWSSYSVIGGQIYREAGRYRMVSDRIQADVDSTYGGARVLRVTSLDNDAFSASLAGGRTLACKLDPAGFAELAARYDRQERSLATATAGKAPPGTPPAGAALAARAAEPGVPQAHEPESSSQPARVVEPESSPKPAAPAEMETASFVPADTPPYYDARRVTQPAYPAAAARRHEEGDVLLQLLVGADGHVRQESVLKSSGSPALDSAALAAVRGWDFTAGTHAGKPVDASAQVKVSFHLGN